MIDPKSDWIELGRNNPYFGVLSSEVYSGRILDERDEKEFFESGVSHIKFLMSLIERCFGTRPSGPGLDFGCGVGRVTIPLAATLESAVGVDISPGMLSIANDTKERLGLKNLSFYNSMDSDYLRQSYGFVHSYIVLQHMGVSEGYSAVEKLVSCLSVGGIGAIHFPIDYQKGSKIKNSVKNIAKRIPGIRAARRLLRISDRPPMLMNKYSLPQMIEILQQNGVDLIHFYRVHDWEVIGVFMLFKKTSNSPINNSWDNPAR